MTMPGSPVGAAEPAEPVLTLSTARLRAEPGGQAQLSITVRHPFTVVDSYRLDLVGLDPDWYQVHPPEVAVYPGSEETALVVLSPPQTAVAPDDALPFGVRAVSTVEAGRSIVEEAELEVGRIFDLQGAVTPVTSSGRWTGRHRVRFTNWGNSAVSLRLSATDKDGKLGFRITPDALTVPVGGEVTARLRVRPSDPFLRGQPVRVPFQVVGEVPGTAPAPGTPRTPAARAGVPDPNRPVLDAAMLHKPVLSRGVVVLLGLLVAAAAALTALAFKASAVDGATRPEAAPITAPSGIEVLAVGGDQVRVRWLPVDLATGYRIQQVDPRSQDVLQPIDVAGDVNAQNVPAEPSTESCYRVVALRAAFPGPPSEPQCATTSDGRLPPPTDVSVAPQEDGTYRVRWTGDPRDGHVVLLDGAPLGQPLVAGVSEAPAVAPPGKHCVQVMATRGGDQSSPPSDPAVCVEVSGTATSPPPSPGGGSPGGAGGTPPSTGTPTTGTNTGTASGWAVWLGQAFQEAPLAEQARRAAAAAGLAEAQVVTGDSAPGLGFTPATLIVVVPGLPDEAAATQFCTTVPAGAPRPCQPVLLTR